MDTVNHQSQQVDSNRRDSERLHARLYADYRVQGTGEKFRSVTRNIAGSGICCSTHQSLPVGSLLDVQIFFPVRKTPVVCRAEVRWNRSRPTPIDTANGFESGLKFIDIEPDERVFIERHVALDVPWDG